LFQFAGLAQLKPDRPLIFLRGHHGSGAIGHQATTSTPLDFVGDAELDWVTEATSVCPTRIPARSSTRPHDTPISTGEADATIH